MLLTGIGQVPTHQFVLVVQPICWVERKRFVNASRSAVGIDARATGIAPARSNASATSARAGTAESLPLRVARVCGQRLRSTADPPIVGRVLATWCVCLAVPCAQDFMVTTYRSIMQESRGAVPPETYRAASPPPAMR